MIQYNPIFHPEFAEFVARSGKHDQVHDAAQRTGVDEVPLGADFDSFRHGLEPSAARRSGGSRQERGRSGLARGEHHTHVAIDDGAGSALDDRDLFEHLDDLLEQFAAVFRSAHVAHDRIE